MLKIVTNFVFFRLTNRIVKMGGDDVSMDFEKLFNAYYMQVYSFVMTLSKNSQISEEITQKTFFKAVTSSKEFRGVSSELTWLCAIARNLFIDEVRIKKKNDEFEDADIPDSDITIEQAFANEESAFKIHQVLHDLEEPYKEVFQLRVFGELSFQKIGTLFNKTESWARVTHHRARLKIQERMEKNEISV